MGDVSPHFNRREFACNCGCGYNTVDIVLLDILEETRRNFDAVITINSGCRCNNHNIKIGGASGSQHLYARAADFNVAGFTPAQVQSWLMTRFSGLYGIGSYERFTHVDSRSGYPSRWKG